jgi:Tfp pilus assembly protein PilF
MPTFCSLLVTISLILTVTGCQTLNDSSEKSAKEDSSTDMSVATAFLESGQPDKAMFELRSILEREPKNAKAHNLMGLAQLALKNPKKAIQHLETAWNLEPTSACALNLSSAYLEANQTEKAKKTIMDGLSLKESKPYKNRERFYHNLGLLAEKKGSLVAAEKAYRKALEENPTFYLSRSRLAMLLEERKKPELARAEWEFARSACPACLEPTVRLINYYERKGDLKTAVGLIQDYRRIEGLNLADAKKATEIESRLNADRARAAQQLKAAPNSAVVR